MADAIRLALDGDKTLAKTFREMEPKIRKKIERKALRRAGKAVLERAKQNVPVESGTLKRSLKLRAMKRSRKRKHLVGVRVVTGKDLFKGEAFYGAFVELGTSRSAAQPYMRPAAKQASTKARSIFRAEFKRILLEESRKAR